MKKTLFSLVFAIMFSLALGSCNWFASGASTEVDTLATDSVALVDSTVVDSVVIAIDTVAVDSVVE